MKRPASILAGSLILISSYSDAGATWSKSRLPAQYPLSTVFSTAAHNVWTAGYGGVVLFQSGSAP